MAGTLISYLPIRDKKIFKKLYRIISICRFYFLLLNYKRSKCLKNIQREYHSAIDKFTQNIIIAQIEQLLGYCERFYQRQFITRAKTNHQILAKVETILDSYFNSEDLIEKGPPTAQYLAEQLYLSPNYLGSLLKSLTGHSTQTHIHEKLIEKAKEKLSTTNLSVSEIAYELGFERSQSFSKLFKSKTKVTPLEFRASFN